ncbi:hypothetical protein AJ79_06029, partial [Helicocarpus griseus UAMH5409]
MHAHWCKVAVLAAATVNFTHFVGVTGFVEGLRADRGKSSPELPAEIHINCNSGECSKEDLDMLKSVMEIASDHPEVFWELKSEVKENDSGTASHVANLIRHDSGIQRNTNSTVRNLVNITGLNYCSSNSCSEKEISTLKQGLMAARLPGFFWKIIGMIGRFNFDYKAGFDL